MQARPQHHHSLLSERAHVPPRPAAWPPAAAAAAAAAASDVTSGTTAYRARDWSRLLSFVDGLVCRSWQQLGGMLPSSC